MTDSPIEKRERSSENGDDCEIIEPPTKVLKREIDSEIEQKLDAIKTEVDALDEQCRDEQILVQCSYDAKKSKHFKDRGGLFKKIPEFWKTVICNFASPTGLMLECETEALTYLEDVFLEDNMDAGGSHKFTFTFKENPYFKESEIVKHIIVKKEDPENCEVKTTAITWTKDVLADVTEADKESSFFNWLQSNVEEREDFGNLFREKVWQEALMVYENEDVFHNDEEFDESDEEEYDDEECSEGSDEDEDEGDDDQDDDEE